MHRIWTGVLLGVSLSFSCFTVAEAKPGSTGSPAAQSSSSSASSSNSSSSSAGSGSTAPFEAQILAYDGVDKVATKVATDACSAIKSNMAPPQGPAGGSAPPPQPASATIVIYDQSAFSSMQAFYSFVQNEQAVEYSYDLLFAQTPHASAGTSVSFSPVSDFTGLVQALAVSSNSLSYGSVAVPDSAVALAITEKLTQGACKGYTIIYPPLFGGGAGSSAVGSIQTYLTALNVARKAAHDVANVKGATSSYPAAALADVDTLYDAVITSLQTQNPNTGLPASAAILQGSELDGLLRQNNTYVLLATVEAAGGTAQDHKSLWTALWNGDVYTFSGGVIVGAALWQPSVASSPIYSHISMYRSDFKSAPVIETAQ